MIPSGLQALMEASAVLQQQASQTAPGPQGQQPTVASQVMQQAQQAAQPVQQPQPMQQPQLQDIGRQAGIAGQLMAQQQQQQQQMAKSPQAVAQMAAQMLQQKGVAGLPVNMQFKAGGIIGFAEGEEVPDVRTQPIPDRSLAPMDENLAAKARREMAEMDSGQRMSLSPDVERLLATDASVLNSRRAAQEAAYAQRERERMLAASRGIAQQARPQVKPPEPVASPAPQASNIPYAGPDERFAPALAPARAPRDDQALPVKTTAKPDGIAALMPERAALPTAPDYNKILSDTPESAESIKRRQELDAARRARADAAKRQPDLNEPGIAALQSAQSAREKILESARSRDTYERLNALFTSLVSRGGNQVSAIENAIQGREEAAVAAKLLHESSVLKLKQAQQARELGQMDEHIQLLKEAQSEEQKAQELRRADAKIKAELAKSKYEVESRERTHASDRVNALKLKLTELAQQEAVRTDAKLRDQYRAASDSLGRQQAELEKQVREKFKTYLAQQGIPGSKPDPAQERAMQSYRDSLTETMITPLEQLVNNLTAKVLGTSAVATPRPTSRNAVDFSKLPTK